MNDIAKKTSGVATGRTGVDLSTPVFPDIDFPILVNLVTTTKNETLCNVTWQCGSHYDVILASKGCCHENFF